MVEGGRPKHQSGEGAGRSPGRPPLHAAADGETEARGGQGLPWGSRRPNSALPDVSSLCRALGPAGERKGLLSFLSTEGENWPGRC